MSSHGVWLQQKQAGENSFAMVKKVTDTLGDVKACHAGALDPFATGLVLVLVGQATRLFQPFHVLPKHYEAEIIWGSETDNLDPTGKVIETADASKLTVESLDEVLQSFVGWHQQTPPAFSNKRVNGERAWRLAQQGEKVELSPTKVYLHEAKWLSHDLPRSSRLSIVSKGGFYVRTLARDIALKLGTRAHLGSLHRSRIGPFSGEGIVPIASALDWCPHRVLSDAELGKLRATAALPSGSTKAATWAAPYPLDPPVALFHQFRPVALWRDGKVETWFEKPREKKAAVEAPVVELDAAAQKTDS